MSRRGLLEGKVALVIGASRGIGAQTARTFVEEGATVVLAARSEDALHALAEELRTQGGTALPVPADLGDEDSIASLVRTTVARFGRLDVAFNNAADGHMPAPLADLSVEDLDRSYRINVRGFFLAMKHQLHAMLASGGGSIVNMASTAGLNGVRGMGAYSATKHAIIGLTRSAALDYADKGIRLNVVAPGPILTGRLQQIPEERRAPIVRAVPMGRIGGPEEVARAVAWLGSDAASFVTGTTLAIDGGRLAGA
ncbi:2,5-dichloro-2,5-cyclohexadiene-1,4-diol dehydrogenase [Myxococcus stipitatus DSM 14675]|uniref:2,5-dichloro-2,5-cyclohexadiene-1,4-diol dehydrogenase n=1 Tax=Myxococcus stipitatus (strain DSM 14675 / JCM 12634 / Mx s8) TaxID=1278073 RepID=L7UCS7_MYXSD|nr:SDR family NAD(P)-dependent oxidoreductase [Myxococcus stipitatus]AGC45848.1 2,5-dichloro-2,5-cyclohexadiene-1,4-diol dehydrogenase [Myxococcus stipitatus DSM 14675]